MRVPEHLSCERFGPLISAYVDDELKADEMSKLAVHLEQCADCRERMQVFSDITDSIFDLADIPASVAKPKEVSARNDVERRKNSERNKSGWLVSGGSSLLRLIPMATAATVVVGLIVASLPSGDTLNAEEVDPEKIAIPLAELELLHQEQRHSQEQMLQMFSLELRSLRLQLQVLGEDSDSNEEREAARIEAQQKIDSLIEKVEQFGDEYADGYAYQ